MALSNHRFLFSPSSPKSKFNGRVEGGLRSYKKLKYFSSSLICVQCHCSTTSFSPQVAISTGGETKFFHGNVDDNAVHRNVVRLGLPSKGRMAEEILALLKDCQLGIRQVNPRQYVAHVPRVAETRFASHTIVLRRLVRVKEALCQMVISNKWGGWKQVDTEKTKIVKDSIFSDDFWNRVEYALELTEPLMSMLRYADTDEPCLGNIYDAMDSMLERMKSLSNLEVWFQRPKDIVRKLMSGDLDLGIIGYDTVCEDGQGNEDLILVHDALEFGQCRLSLAIPDDGIYKNISTLNQLAAMPQWTAERPLRITTGYTNLGKAFSKENGLIHVTFLTEDGVLEAAPAMGLTDAILDLVSSGTTLRENNLKELEGGLVLDSQGVFVANKKALVQHRDVLEIAHEMLERLEAHLKAVGEFKVTAHMRGSSEQEVAETIFMHTDFHGFQGPTVGPVYSINSGEVQTGYYDIMLCVPKKDLYKCVRQLRAAGGSGVLVSPLTYIFDEEPSRWRKLLDQLNL